MSTFKKERSADFPDLVETQKLFRQKHEKLPIRERSFP